VVFKDIGNVCWVKLCAVAVGKVRGTREEQKVSTIETFAGDKGKVEIKSVYLFGTKRSELETGNYLLTIG